MELYRILNMVAYAVIGNVLARAWDKDKSIFYTILLALFCLFGASSLQAIK